MAIQIRTAEPSDYQQIAELQTLARGQLISEEDLRSLDRDSRAGSFSYRVVGEVEGNIIATGRVIHSVWHQPGQFRIWVVVAPEHRRARFGGQLADHLEAVAKGNGAEILVAQAREGLAEGLNFLDSRGYSTIANKFESVLDLTSYEPPSVQCEMSGLRVFSFAETEMGEAEKRKLWDLNVETGRDEPMNDSNYRPTFEEFEANVINASWFDPAGQLFAVDGDEWVAMTAVEQVFGDEFYNLFTGVRRSHRGRGLAKMLKVLATTRAKQLGATTIRTNNDSRNAAMLAINSWLGYKPEPGWIIGSKPIG